MVISYLRRGCLKEPEPEQPAEPSRRPEERERPHDRLPAVSGQQFGRGPMTSSAHGLLPCKSSSAARRGGDGLTISDRERDADRGAVSTVGACGSSSDCGTGSTLVRSSWPSDAGGAARSPPAAATAPEST